MEQCRRQRRGRAATVEQCRRQRGRAATMAQCRRERRRGAAVPVLKIRPHALPHGCREDRSERGRGLVLLRNPVARETVETVVYRMGSEHRPRFRVSPRAPGVGGVTGQPVVLVVGRAGPSPDGGRDTVQLLCQRECVVEQQTEILCAPCLSGGREDLRGERAVPLEDVVPGGHRGAVRTSAWSGCVWSGCLWSVADVVHRGAREGGCVWSGCLWSVADVVHRGAREGGCVWSGCLWSVADVVHRGAREGGVGQGGGVSVAHRSPGLRVRAVVGHDGVGSKFVVCETFPSAQISQVLL